MHKRHREGFSLIEIMVAMAVMTVLLSMAVTNAVQIMHGYHVQQARTQVTRVRDLSTTLALCNASPTPPQPCTALPAMLPATGQLTTQEYTFNYTGPGSTWSYTATPQVEGMMSLYTDQTGVMRCSMNPTSPAGPASPACQ
jgi:prepilin-type N-terminal cleavage/methylation domain-containing protein